MQLIEITTYAEVRSALGIDAKELSDNTLALDLYATGLKIELQEIAAALPADFVIVSDIDEATRTEAQQNFFDAVKVFAPYAVAVQLASTLPLGAPKSITDGKAGVTRDSNSPYKAAIDAAKVAYARYRIILAARYATFKSTSSTTALRPWMLAVSPIEDPVAGV